MTTWTERIGDLESRGWAISAIAGEIGITAQSVSDIKAGRSKEPRGMAAVKLHALHARVMAEPAPAADTNREAA